MDNYAELLDIRYASGKMSRDRYITCYSQLILWSMNVSVESIEGAFEEDINEFEDNEF